MIWGDLSYRPIGWEAATGAAIRAMLEGLEPVDISVSFRGYGSGGEVAETSARYETHLYDLSALKEAVG